MTVAVIGAGAAGLIAAGRAAKEAERVLLIEKNDAVGRKLRITGKGRCNITNACDTEDMIGKYPANGKFLYSALYTFGSADIIALLESLGVPVKTERGMRVFPVSDDARDVVAAMRRYALGNGARLIKANATGLVIGDGRVCGVKTTRGEFAADRVIVCTGGKSYPTTGSNGAGYRFAEQAGHTVIPPTPSLVPFETKERPDLSGLSLKNVSAAVYNSAGKRIAEEFGEMLFTAFGVSGPIILTLSTRMRGIDPSECSLLIDLKPALAPEKLDARILRDFAAAGKKQLINSLGALLPKALIPVVVERSDISPHTRVGDITRTQRHALGAVIKGLRFHITGFRPIEEAIVTAGGVSTREINSSTMESKLVKGLYFAGEVIDIDGVTGGFNLQAAWSTGYLAGMNAAADTHKR